MTTRFDTYICALCKQEFKKDARSDETALAESRELFGEFPESDLETVCEDCFKEFMEWYEGGGKEECLSSNA